ncbi:MAG: hypothetical protein RQ966_06945 [Acetobacteraceae bacterium]|nr:hypothetical protein [Acetobacteraceae bacterium]
MNAPLTRRRLEWLVRARGTDLSLWPDAERAAALALLHRSLDAQTEFAEALAADDGPEPGMDADRAVVARMQAALRRRLAPLSLAARGLCVGALVACVAAGLYLAVDPSPEAPADLFNTAQTVTFASLDQ